MFFSKKVDLRSKSAMVDFLNNHPKHDGYFSHTVKIGYLALRELKDKAFDVLSTDFWPRIESPLDEFTDRHNDRFAIISAGRSAGHLELRHAQRRYLEYKSYCQTCGQQNYRKVAEELPADPFERAVALEIMKSGGIWLTHVYLGQEAIAAFTQYSDEEKMAVIDRLKPTWKTMDHSNRCGRCNAAGDDGRINYEEQPSYIQVMNTHFDFDWDLYDLDDLRDMVRLVQDFDRACDQVRDKFIQMLSQCEVVEETYMVPRTDKVLRCAC